MELQESKNLWFLQDDIEVPCIMQRELLWYPAQSHLNHVLINVGVFQACHDKTIKKAILRPRSTAPRPDLLSENEGDDLIHDCEVADISEVSMESCLSVRER